MNSIQTKETPNALVNLLKAKGQNTNKDIAIVRTPINVMEKPKTTEVAATSTEDPVTPSTTSENGEVTATPEVKNPEPTENRSDGRDSPAYREFKQYHDKTVFELRTQVTQLESQLQAAAAPKIAFPKTREEMEEFRKQNPEGYDMMKTVALEAFTEHSQDINSKLEEVNKAQRDLAEKEAFQRLLKKHPDAMEIRKSPAFAEWFNNQPSDIKTVLSKSSDVDAVAKLIDLYKLEVLGVNTKQQKKEEAKQREEASLGVDIKAKPEITAQKKVWTKTEIDQICANHNLWKQHAAEIDLARREGRVDMSK